MISFSFCKQPDRNLIHIDSIKDTIETNATKAQNTQTVNLKKDSIFEHIELTTCQTEGALVEQFEQNNAKFERFQGFQEDFQWVKVTTKDGKCFIIDSIEVGNQHSSSFEDWDKDGFRDRIYSFKWVYEVYLFDKTKNDFSRKVKGDFNGEQWDFDRKLNLKFQFLETKYGGDYQLYQLKGTSFRVLSEIRIINEPEVNPKKTRVEIRKNIARSEEGTTYDTLSVDKNFCNYLQEKENEEYEVWLNRTKNKVKTYWKNNLSLFINKDR